LTPDEGWKTHGFVEQRDDADGNRILLLTCCSDERVESKRMFALFGPNMLWALGFAQITFWHRRWCQKSNPEDKQQQHRQEC
jgi:hypothetical protein